MRYERFPCCTCFAVITCLECSVLLLIHESSYINGNKDIPLARHLSLLPVIPVRDGLMRGVNGGSKWAVTVCCIFNLKLSLCCFP